MTAKVGVRRPAVRPVARLLWTLLLRDVFRVQQTIGLTDRSLELARLPFKSSRCLTKLNESSVTKDWSVTKVGTASSVRLLLN